MKKEASKLVRRRMRDELSEAERKVMDPLLRKINGAPEGEMEHSPDHPQACLNQRFP